jgi:hypothetical protein
VHRRGERYALSTPLSSGVWTLSCTPVMCMCR